MKKLIFFLLVLVISSCRESNQDAEPVGAPSQDKFKVENGVLRFENLDVFLATAEQLGGMSHKEYSEWATTRGFKSRYSEYIAEAEKITSGDFIPRPNGPMVKNQDKGYYSLNSVNSNYARVTNEDGAVYIGKSTYIFTAKEIKKLDKISRQAIDELLVANKESYAKLGIIGSDVLIKEPTPNAKTAEDYTIVESKEQQGNDIMGDAFWKWYVNAKFEIRGYHIPTCSFCPPPTSPNRWTAILEVCYYADGLLQKTKEIPQRFELEWSFVRFAIPYPNGQGETITGSYIESDVKVVNRTLSDMGSIIYSYDITAKALDYKGSDLKTSLARIVKTQ